MLWLLATVTPKRVFGALEDPDLSLHCFAPLSLPRRLTPKIQRATAHRTSWQGFFSLQSSAANPENQVVSLKSQLLDERNDPVRWTLAKGSLQWYHTGHRALTVEVLRHHNAPRRRVSLASHEAVVHVELFHHFPVLHRFSITSDAVTAPRSIWEVVLNCARQLPGEWGASDPGLLTGTLSPI